MKKIYINGRFLAQRTSGVQRVAICLLQALDSIIREQDLGIKFIVLCPQSSRPITLESIEVRRVGFRCGSLHLWEQIILPIFCSDATLLSIIGSAPLVKRRVVLMIHDAAVFDIPNSYTKLFSLWYRFTFNFHSKRATGLVTVSEYSHERLSQRLCVSPERIHVAENGADHLSQIIPDFEVINRLRLEGRDFFLAVGGENPSKNIGVVIQALRHSALRDRYALVVVGGNNTNVYAGTELENHSVNVVRTDFVDDQSLKALYASATALLFPSLYEGFGLPPLEAMACGCPVIASCRRPMSDICLDSAILAEPTDPTEWIRAMNEVTDPKVRENLIRAGLDRATNFTWRNQARTILELLRSVA